MARWCPAPMLCRRRGHSATLLADGRVLLAGGGGRSSVPSEGVCDFGHPRSHDSVEVFDPTEAISRATGSLSTPREAHHAALLADGSVLVAGGWGDYG